METNKTLIKIVDLKKYFPLKKTRLFQKNVLNVKANDGINLEIKEGETLGLVGESGCGKSTLGRVILQLYPATSGKTFYYGITIEEFLPKYIFQDIRRLSKLRKKYQNLQSKLETIEGEEEKKDVNEKIGKVLNLSAESTGAFILHNQITQVQNLLLNNARMAYKKNALLKRQIVLEMHIMKLEQEDYEKEGKINESKIAKLKIKLEKIKDDVKSISTKASKVSEQLSDHKNAIKDLSLFKDLESKRERGLDLNRLTREEARIIRRELQIIFQDPYSSLNPRMTVGQIIGEGIKAHRLMNEINMGYQDYILNVMDACGLAPYMLHRYPHQFSGGQRQRIGIARALALNPKFIVCDEAVSALDVSIQSQIINLLEDLRDEKKLTYLFISHDLSVIKHISNRIGVMYLGNIVELADSESIYNNPLHPYTKALISAIPTTEQERKKKIILKGDIPSNVTPPSGCKFRTRCPLARERCALEEPTFREVLSGRFVACHYYEETKDLRPTEDN